MAIKFGMTIAEMIAQLTRGFRSVAGRDPDGLEKIKIQQEAVQRFKDMNKVVDMKGQTLDPSKTIMGGTQEGAALRSGIMKATGAKPISVVKKNLEGVAKSLEANQKRKLNFFKNLDDNKKLTDDEYEDFLEELGVSDEYLEAYDFDRDTITVGSAKKILKDQVEEERYMFDQYRKGKLDPEDMAQGGRAGFKSGSYLFEGAKKLGRKYKGSTLEAILENPKLLGTELGYEGLAEILRLIGMKDGGRIGYKDGPDQPGRRKFMKIIGGLAALPIVGKFFKVGKVAAPAAQAVKETVQQAPNYFFELADKIRRLGRESKVTPQERVREINYKGKDGSEYTLTEDLTTGDMQITKDRPGMAYSDEVGGYDVIEDRTVMEYKSGKGMADETTGAKVADEYDEYKVEFDPDGTPADATDVDEITKIEIVKEVTGEAPSIKKAGGGIATMLGE